MNTNMIKDLLKIAQDLDARGLHSEADKIDEIVSLAIGPTHSSGPEAAPGAAVPAAPAHARKGAIQRPKDPYTYDWLEAERAFVVRTTPPGKESSIGAKIREGKGGWAVLRKHIPETSSYWHNDWNPHPNSEHYRPEDLTSTQEIPEDRVSF